MPHFKFDHSNLTVLDIDRSLNFYEKALGLTEFARLETESYIFVYMGDPYRSEHVLELQAIKSRKLPYNVRNTLAHLAFTVKDFDAAYKKHKELNCICNDAKNFGLYFIEDPDGYQLEILPENWGK